MLHNFIFNMTLLLGLIGILGKFTSLNLFHDKISGLLCIHFI